MFGVMDLDHLKNGLIRELSRSTATITKAGPSFPRVLHDEIGQLRLS
jgi:hypothetical protein